MRQTFRQSWTLLKGAFKILIENKKLLIFPLIAGIFCLFLIASFIIPSLGMLTNTSNLAQPSSVSLFTLKWFAGLLFFYYLCSVVITYCRVAIIGCVNDIANGKKTTLTDGFRIANQRVGAIALWSLVAGTIGFIIRLLENHRAIGRFIGIFLGVSWTLISFLALPVLVIEKRSPFAAIGEAMELFKNAWGQEIIGVLSLNVIYYVFYFPAYLIIIFSIIYSSTLSLWIGLSLGILLLLLGTLFDSLMHGIYQTILFQFTKTGDMPQSIRDILLDEHLFDTKKIH